MSEEIEKLEAEIAELQARKQAILAAQRTGALDDIKKKIKQFGFGPSDVFDELYAPRVARRTGPKGAVTFRDPEKGLEWDGRLEQKGRKPGWIQERIKDGTIELYRVGASGERTSGPSAGP